MAIEDLENALKSATAIHLNDPKNEKTNSSFRLAIEALGKEVIRLNQEIAVLKSK